MDTRELLWRRVGRACDLYACAPGGVYSILVRRGRHIVMWRVVPTIASMREALAKDALAAIALISRQILGIHTEMELAKREALAHYHNSLPQEDLQDEDSHHPSSN